MESKLVISCRMVHNWIKINYSMLFKSYEHFHLLATDGPTYHSVQESLTFKILSCPETQGLFSLFLHKISDGVSGRVHSHLW